MTNQQHPLTPPSELVQQWLGEFFGCTVSGELSHSERFLATRAAQWGADQELEACCEWLPDVGEMRAMLRAARRPKPPSLKEQALKELDDAVMRGDCITVSEALPTIRRALEQLPE
jgi:hypothetical protein